MSKGRNPDWTRVQCDGTPGPALGLFRKWCCERLGVPVPEVWTRRYLPTVKPGGNTHLARILKIDDRRLSNILLGEVIPTYKWRVHFEDITGLILAKWGRRKSWGKVGLPEQYIGRMLGTVRVEAWAHRVRNDWRTRCACRCLLCGTLFYRDTWVINKCQREKRAMRCPGCSTRAASTRRLLQRVRRLFKTYKYRCENGSATELILSAIRHVRGEFGRIKVRHPNERRYKLRAGFLHKGYRAAVMQAIR